MDQNTPAQPEQKVNPELENQLQEIKNINKPPQTNNAPVTNNNALPSFINLLKSAWHIYTKHYKTYIGIAAIKIALFMVAGILFAIIFAVVGFSAAAGIAGAVVDGGAGNIFTSVGIIGGLVLLLLILAALVASHWIDAALTIAVIDQTQATFGNAFKKAWKLIIPFIVITIAVGLSSAGGFLLFIIPGIFISVIVSMSIFVMINEGKRGYSALARSWEYISGKWWQVFWRFAGLILVGIGIGLLIMLIAYLTKNEAMYGLLNMLFSIFNLFIWWPLTIIFNYALYLELKARHTENATPKSSALFKVFSVIGILIFILPWFMIATFVNSGLPALLDSQSDFMAPNGDLNMELPESTIPFEDGSEIQFDFDGEEFDEAEFQEFLKQIESAQQNN